MKKLSIALALLLCVVLCVFCFASCGKKKATSTTADQGTTPAGTTADQGTTPAGTTVPGTTVPGTTAPVTTEGHVHTPETEYTVDTPENCTNPGSKSYHCAECGAIIEGTEVVIPADPTKHVVNEWTVTKEATIFEDGAKSGTCTVCSQTIEEVVAEVFNEYKYTTDSTDALSKSKNFGSEILGEDVHFYPTDANPNGLDFHIEFSFLWNADLLKMSNVGNSKNQVLTGCIGNQDAYWMALTTNAKGCDNKVAPGGFEYVACRTVEYGPAGMSEQTATGGKVGNTYADFPNIGGADQANPEYGWHRLAIVAHEELLNEAALKADTEAKATAAEYRFSFTVYVDGVKLYTLSNRADAAFNASTYRAENMLFTAESDGQGGIVYKDIDASKNVTWIQIPTFQTTEGTAYAVYADEAIFAGNDFAQKVVKVVAPADNVYTTKDGASIPAKIWFEIVADHEHVWDGNFTETKAATLLGDGEKVEHCTICNTTHKVAVEFVPDVQKFTDATTKSYNPNIAKLSDIRGDKHFYDAGNDLLAEFSILWTEEIKDLKTEKDKGPYMDSRFTQSTNPDSTNKNIIYWSLCDNCYGSDCKFAGGFEWGGIDANEPDNPYPKFTDGALGLGTTKDEYPNIGGANGGDGTPQGEDRYGWHRVSIRYRQEVANVDAVKAGGAAEYKLSLWVYIDGVLVIHSSATDFIYRPGKSDQKDYKLFTAASDGNGGITYVENDNLYFSGAYLHYKQMAEGKVAYFAIADYSATIGTDFVQNVARIDYPVEAQLEVEDGVFVPATMWYTVPCAEHTWDGEFTVIEEPTLLNDGLKVEHCSVCGMSHEVALEAAPVITDSKNLAASPYADNQNKDLAILKNASDIRGEGHFYPESTEVGAQGNDLWFEYSFLYNETLYYRDTPANLAEMRLFAFRSISQASKYRGFYYLYFRNNNDGFATSGDCPFAGHIDYSTYLKGCSPDENCADDLTSLGNTLNGVTIGRYAAGWKGKRTDSPYLWDSEWQTLGGWHRLGFRYHQEVASVEGSTVAYAGYTELYIDGVLCWRVHTNVHPTDGDSLMKKGLLLWTATAADGAITGYADNDDVRVGLRLDNLAGSSQNVYVGIDDVQWSMGDGFVHPVVRVENPKPVKYTVAEGVEVDGAMYYAYAHDHVWDEDYEVTVVPTMTTKGTKIDHCSICGETRETEVAETEPVVLDGTLASAPSGWGYNKNMFTDRVELSTLAQQKGSFYPTETNPQGNDLLVEFSFLWNETFDFGADDSCIFIGRFDKKGGNPAYTTIWLHLGTCGDCPFLGGFELNTGSGVVKFGPDNDPISVDHPEEFTNIGAYGWHRLALRFHQTAEIVEGAVKYTLTYTFYVDGEKVSEVETDPNRYIKDGYLLYEATIDPNDATKLVYTDNTQAQKHFTWLRRDAFFGAESERWMVLGDYYVTSGHDFVLDVEPVATPEANTFTPAEGASTYPAAFYYSLK